MSATIKQLQQEEKIEAKGSPRCSGQTALNSGAAAL
jgi:hypothetical protein